MLVGLNRTSRLLVVPCFHLSVGWNGCWLQSVISCRTHRVIPLAAARSPPPPASTWALGRGVFQSEDVRSQPPALFLLFHLSEALTLGCQLWRGWGLCPMGVDTTRWFWVIGPKEGRACHWQAVLASNSEDIFGDLYLGA